MSKKKQILYGSILAVIVIATIVVVIVSAYGKTETDPAPVSPEPPAAARSSPVQVIEVEKTISTEMISERLQDMGMLVTEEYVFTEVVSFSSVKKLWEIELGFTESGYVASYDGVVTAGLDFTQIRLEKDDELRRITVYLPRTKILNIDIDPTSFQLYSEKEGLWNRISVTDYNNSLIEMEETAREKALAKGILERAGSNARLLIENLIRSLIDDPEYDILCLYA